MGKEVMSDVAPPSLKDLLLTILVKQQEMASSFAMIFADLETLRMSLWTLSPDPGFSKRLDEAIQANRDRYAKELAAKHAELALLQASVSKIVQ
jgi:hypothetical protein